MSTTYCQHRQSLPTNRVSSWSSSISCACRAMILWSLRMCLWFLRSMFPLSILIVHDSGATMSVIWPFHFHSAVHSSWIVTLWFWENPFGVAPVDIFLSWNLSFSCNTGPCADVAGCHIGRLSSKYPTHHEVCRWFSKF